MQEDGGYVATLVTLGRLRLRGQLREFFGLAVKEIIGLVGAQVFQCRPGFSRCSVAQ